MIVAGVPFASIDLPGLELLVQERVPESRTHDYKSQLPDPRNDDAKTRTLRSICAFANSAGGVLIFGLNSETGGDWALSGLAEFDEDRDVASLTQLIRTGIQPQLPRIVTRVVRRQQAHPVLLLGIPRSLAAPHCISEKYKGGFHRRDERGNRAMDVYELREAFEEGDRWMRGAEEFRDQRAKSLPSGKQAPHVNVAHGLAILHLVPLGRASTQIDAEAVVPYWRDHFQPRFAQGQALIVRPTLDGWLNLAGGDDLSRHVLIFRNGAIEVGHSLSPWFAGIDAQPPVFNELRGGFLERHVVRWTTRAISWLQNAGIAPPFAVFLTLLGVAGVQLLGTAEIWDTPEQGIDRSDVKLPPMILEDYPANVATALHPLLNTLWQAASWRNSPYFTAAGEWRLNLD